MLLGAVLALVLLLVLALVGWARAPSAITLHYPPDLSTGAQQQLGSYPRRIFTALSSISFSN